MKHAYKSFSRVCREGSAVTQDMIDSFNENEGFDNLPTNRELKCYMFCQMEQMEFMVKDVPSVDLSIVAESIEIFTREEQDIFLNMGRKCSKIKIKSKDVCDVAYEFNVCLKKGDNIVRPISKKN